ncbi:MAG: hypothetical protein HY738_14190 [Bacteroidia bacterium]|nr:hypothetical protein [Bacteroidia bacterium]
MKILIFKIGFLIFIVPFCYSQNKEVKGITGAPVSPKFNVLQYTGLTAYQNQCALRIINAEPLIRDEVAYQIAHLAPSPTLISMNKDLPVINAQGVYQIAPELQYVELVEHGDPAQGDWYTTTRYRIIVNNGDTVWREIPFEATDPRPIQPNLILHDHDGNCGEVQDLQNAGARIGLIPTVSVGSWPGDHVWCEFYSPDSAK